MHLKARKTKTHRLVALSRSYSIDRADRMAENGVKRRTKHTILHLMNCAHIHSTDHLHDSPDFEIHSVAVDGHR
jgi:hypothetical protein